VKVALMACPMCECGNAMAALDRPFQHIVYCANNACSHYGELFESPRIEAIPAKAHRQS